MNIHLLVKCFRPKMLVALLHILWGAQAVMGAGATSGDAPHRCAVLFAVDGDCVSQGLLVLVEPFRRRVTVAVGLPPTAAKSIGEDLPASESAPRPSSAQNWKKIRKRFRHVEDAHFSSAVEWHYGGGFLLLRESAKFYFNQRRQNEQFASGMAVNKVDPARIIVAWKIWTGQ